MSDQQDPAGAGPIVVVIGSRYADLEVESSVLGDLARVVESGASSPDEIAAAASGADVILAGSNVRLDEEVMERLTCRGIVRAGVGVDNIDLDSAARLGLWVVNVPDYGTESVAWHSLALIAAGMRRLKQADLALGRGEWGIGGLRPLHGPSGATLGIVGFGRIGRRLWEMASGVGFSRILVHDPFSGSGDPGVELVSLEALLAGSDVVSLHVPGSEGGPLLDAEKLALLRPGSVLVNTARGSLIDMGALAKGLSLGRPGIAALDVFPEEPPVPGLLADVADRTILTPHMAWYTEESEEALRRKAAGEARRILLGEEPINAVIRPARTSGAGKEQR